MNPCIPIVLTGGPGGGKTTFIDESRRNIDGHTRVVALSEAIFVAGRAGIRTDEQLFQRLMVETQRALEEAISNTLPQDDTYIVLCHRGTLDPLAYWLKRGWSEEAFFAFTGTKRADHYQRYRAVIHLVTAADGAAAHYLHWPQAHRPETPDQAILIDRLLEQVLGSHPHYHRIDNTGRDWATKSHAARKILERYV